MDFNSVFAVLLVVCHAQRLCREFALLAGKHETGAELDSQGGTHDESSGFDTDYLCNAFVFVKIVKNVFEFPDAVSVLIKRGHIPEQNSLDREIRNRSDIRF